MKAPHPAGFIDSDELRDQKARSRARRLKLRVDGELGCYSLRRNATDSVIADHLTLDKLEEWLDRLEEEDPVETMKSIIAENPGATEDELYRMFRSEVLSDERLQEMIAMEAFEMLKRA